MEDISLWELLKAVDGKYYGKDLGNFRISSVSTDSRACPRGCLFIPLRGERFDGHDFISDAHEKGAVCSLSEEAPDIRHDLENVPLILVRSTHTALMRLAEYYLSKFKLPVIAVTGSSGKTTVKEMTAAVLGRRFSVLKTDGNYNNEIGLPLTVFNLDRKFNCAVLEMGMNHYGEMERLSKVAKPDICLITNIGYAHIENFENQEGILKAKAEIFTHMKQKGMAVLNGDDKMLRRLKISPCLYFGLGPGNDVFATEIEYKGLTGIGCTINYKNEKFTVHIPSPGRHTVQNALAAAAVGYAMGLSSQEIKTGLESFVPPKMRMNIINTNNITIINDTYNANPSSMRSALDVLMGAHGRKVCILGDMNELGEHAEEMHYSLGEYCAGLNPDCIIYVGKYKAFSRALSNHRNAHFFPTQEALHRVLPELIKPNDTILVKASRGVQLEKTVEKLVEVNHGY